MTGVDVSVVLATTTCRSWFYHPNACLLPNCTSNFVSRLKNLAVGSMSFLPRELDLLAVCASPPF